MAKAALEVGWPMAVAAGALMVAMWLVLKPLLAGWSAAWRQASVLTVPYALAIAVWLLVEYALLVAFVVAVAINGRRPPQGRRGSSRPRGGAP